MFNVYLKLLSLLKKRTTKSDNSDLVEDKRLEQQIKRNRLEAIAVATILANDESLKKSLSEEERRELIKIYAMKSLNEDDIHSFTK